MENLNPISFAGVIWENLYDEIPGSSAAVKYLREIGKQVVFVTNNSFLSTKDQLSKFANCGLDIEEVGGLRGSN